MQATHREGGLSHQARAHDHFSFGVDEVDLTGFFGDDAQQSLATGDVEEHRLGSDLHVEVMAEEFFLEAVEHLQFLSVEIDEVGILVAVEVLIEEEMFLGICPEIGAVECSVGGDIEQFAFFVGSQEESFAVVGYVGIDVGSG